MDRVLRAITVTLLVTFFYNVTAVIADHIHAPVLSECVRIVNHGHGFSLGIAAGCLATGELALLVCMAASVLAVTWPTDLVHLTFAYVAGGLLGKLIATFVRQHRHDGKPIPRPDAR